MLKKLLQTQQSETIKFDYFCRALLHGKAPLQGLEGARGPSERH